MSSVTAESAVVPPDTSSVDQPVGSQCDDNRGTAPRRPGSLKDAGLSLSQLSDFVLKSLYLNGSLTGYEIALGLGLPVTALEEGLRFLSEQRCVDVKGGDRPGPTPQRFALTELGRARARDALEDCRYVGPAPVPLSDYIVQCRRQAPDQVDFSRGQFQDAFRHLVISPELLDELGPAVCSGRSILLHGPPGNGKSVIARAIGALLNTQGGEIYVPYAILAENSIITVFDPAIHEATDVRRRCTPETPATAGEIGGGDPDTDFDQRWRRIRRPVVTAGGELTLDMLDLREHASGRFYSAPLQLKANGGVFLIDDFGRQPVSPEKLVNRWILPLEERMDYLTLRSGGRIAVPFCQLVILSTSRKLCELVDEAFLRRIRHRIQIAAPARDVFEQIFHDCCLARGFPYDRRHVDLLFEQHYNRQRLPRASDPQDLLETAAAVCRFRGEPPRFDVELLSIAAERLFRDV